MRRIAFLLTLLSGVMPATGETPFLASELIFPLESWHNHSSCIIETPRGDLLVCWYHGSGERTADDVKIEGARRPSGARAWSPRFTMADTPGYPDTNCILLIDAHNRLWLIWPTILANEWETALLKYKIASSYEREGVPEWQVSEVLHVTPGPEFERTVSNYTARMEDRLNSAASDQTRALGRQWLEGLRKHASDKFYRRLGWMPRAHAFVLDGTRLIVPLYSDGCSFSLMAITDDWGATWHTSTPLPGQGNIQPSIVRRRDGSLYTLMRDNGLPPKRLHQSESRDRGETWSEVTDSDLPNPGSGAEVISLRNGHWVLVGNDTERGRHSLAVQISEDEGKTWPWTRHLELDAPGPEAGSYHYPSIIEARDGTLHATYSYFAPKSGGKSIKHAHFNEAWIRSGE
jgi:predicted neuraminidase